MNCPPAEQSCYTASLHTFTLRTMKQEKLGNSDISVSRICLGTMTWGEQNTEGEAFAQMDYALDRGVNFWDTAELYPVPPREQTTGLTETFIGNWFARSRRRSEVVLATKVTGRSNRSWVRGGRETRLNREQINAALEGSLKRLQTDCIDLYQLHWPDRRLGLWGEGNGSYLHKAEEDEIAIEETLEVLAELVKQGKVRAIGLSNETPWGLAQFLELSRSRGLPRVVSMQNSYSLLNRIYEGGLSEFAFREQVGLLAYSPLGMGSLSGKYRDGKRPQGSRMARFPGFMPRYQKPLVEEAIERYCQLAREFDLTPTQLALGFVNTRPFLGSNIVGATSLAQLEENIDCSQVEISAELEEEIDRIHALCKSPAAA